MDLARGVAGRFGGGRLLSRFYTDQRNRLVQLRLAGQADSPWSPAAQYDLLERYYSNMEIYDGATRAMAQAAETAPAARGLRTPAFQVVEFYVATVWPGRLDDALKIELVDAAEGNTALEPAIKRVWAWSNWEQTRQVHVRLTTMLGDGFVKVALTPAKDRVYFQLLKAAHVTAIDADERGYLTYCRIDVPLRVERAGVLTPRTHTEVWSKEAGTFRRWAHDRGDRPVDELGAPDEEIPLRAMHGDDFVPIVHTKFRDVGDDRGAGAYLFQLDKIDEHNRKATRLGQQLFRHNGNTWVLERVGTDASGRPLPPLAVGTDPASGGLVVQLGDESMFVLPGSTTVKSIVPQIDYAAALAAEQADGIELQRDLVEKAYWQIMEHGGDLSGRALRTLLLPAIARAEEARGTFEQGLVRLDQMACTIARFNRIAGFEDIGDYKAGEMDHRFADRPVIPISEDEEADTAVKSWTAAKLQKDAGVSTDQVLKERGYSDEEIADMGQAREADQTALDEAVGALMERQPGSTAPVAAANGRPANGQVPPNANGGSNG